MINGRERQYCTILTEDEELPILSYVKNKNVALKSITRAEVIRLIIDVLKIREYASKKMKSDKNMWHCQRIQSKLYPTRSRLSFCF